MQDTPEFAQMQSVLFPFLASALFIIIHIIIYYALIRKISTKRRVTGIYAAILWTNMTLSIIYMFAKSYFLMPFWAFLIASISVGVAFSFFMAALVSLILEFALWIYQKRRIPTRFKRIILALCFIYSGYAIYHGLETPELKRLSIEMPNLKKELKIVQLSDVHIGGLIDEERIAQMVYLINQENPDLITITGDLVDTKMENGLKALSVLSGLRSKYGTFYVLGNHEYIHDVYEILDSIRNTNIRVLMNENLDFDDFNLIGVADLMGNRVGFLKPDFDKAYENLKANKANILLAHQPKVIEVMPKELLEKTNLILSGHTHGGQIFPFSLFVLLQQPFLNGLHKLEHNGFIYVSEGSGFWGPPMRAFSDAEITIFTILPKK